MSSDEAKVRAGQPADIPAIRAMAQASVGAALWDAQAYARVFDIGSIKRTLLVAEGGAISEPRLPIGFIIARVVGDEWEIENIVVTDRSQRKGVGQLLLGSLIAQARHEGAKVVQLEVRASNHAAIALYKKSQFSEDGLRKAYYSEPVEDALLFSLSLRNSS